MGRCGRFEAANEFISVPGAADVRGNDPGFILVANDKVVIAEDLFFPSNVVFIDHGDGLITRSFHLSEITVHTNTFTNCRYDRTHSHLIPLKGRYWVTCNGAQ